MVRGAQGLPAEHCPTQHTPIVGVTSADTGKHVHPAVCGYAAPRHDKLRCTLYSDTFGPCQTSVKSLHFFQSFTLFLLLKLSPSNVLISVLIQIQMIFLFSCGRRLFFFLFKSRLLLLKEAASWQVISPLLLKIIDI